MPTSPKRPDERRADFVAAALAALDETLQSGKGFDAKKVHDYLRAKVSGKASARPRAKSWREESLRRYQAEGGSRSALRVLVTTLTKRMAEDLTDYLAEHGVRVRYLHADIETVERVEIIRDLRLGAFDVLVGINLLREGLDMPEVALVAVLDADKEGFLRSEQSLIQTIGRAARNLHGRAILYADSITGSMQRALAETDRRRAKQMAYNAEHGITPRSVTKAIGDLIDIGRSEAPARRGQQAKVAEPQGDYRTLNAKQLGQLIARLEQEMYRHAENLEFEQAAKVRDRIHAVRESALRGDAVDVGVG